jgi:hypothetical protein
MKRAISIGLLTVSVAACEGSVAAPSKLLNPSPARPTTFIAMVVEDSAFRGLPGVTVEIVDGPQAGTSGVSDVNGRIRFEGTSKGAVNVRASKDGYEVSTKTLTWTAVGQFRIDFLSLELLGPSLTLEPGDYTMTVTADSSCTAIPESLRTRVYAARVAPFADHPRTHLSVSVGGASLVGFGFALGIAGNDVGFTIDGPAFFETLPGFTYVEIAGGAPNDEHATSTGSTVSIPFYATFEYCQLKSERGRFNNCFTTPADQKIAYGHCSSPSARMVLSR